MPFTSPPDFRYQPPEVQLASTVQGVASVLPVAHVPIEDNGILGPTMGTFVGTAAGALQDISGVPFGTLTNLAFDAVAIGQATDALGTLQAVGQLFDAGVDAAVEVAQAVGAATDMVEVIPLVGQVADIFLGIYSSFLQSEAHRKQLTQQCRKDAQEYFNGWCQQLSINSQPVSSGGSGGMLPSDLFRQLAYLRQKGSKAFPANASSLYLALCGGAPGDFAVLTDDQYEKEAVAAGVKGSSRATREKMWTLVSGLMDSVQPAEIGVKVDITSGRTLMPILQEIVGTEFVKGSGLASEEGINHAFIHRLSNKCLEWTRHSYPCPQGATLASVQGSCGVFYNQDEPRLRLGNQFIQAIMQFNQDILQVPDLQSKIAKAVLANTHVAQVKLPMRTFQGIVVPALGDKKKGLLVVSDSTASMLDKIKQGQSGTPRRPSTLAITAATLALGAGSIYGARRLAKR